MGVLAPLAQQSRQGTVRRDDHARVHKPVRKTRRLAFSVFGGQNDHNGTYGGRESRVIREVSGYEEQRRTGTPFRLEASSAGGDVFSNQESRVTERLRTGSLFSWLGSPRIVGFAVVLGVAAFVLGSISQLPQTDEPGACDTAGYLSMARTMKQRGGPLGLLVDCYTGAYREANRMPTYSALLSFLPFSRGLDVLTPAKAATMVMGAVGLLAAYLMARRLFGQGVALLAVALLAVNTAYQVQGSIIACEVLLAMWLCLGWGCIVLYLRGSLSFVWVGVVIALAYLAKANGLFLAPVALGALLWKERAGILRQKHAWWALLACLVIASPILVRNVRVFGSPLHNYNTKVLWMEEWYDNFSTDPQQSNPDWRSYVRRHTAGEMAARLGKGAFQQGIYAVVCAGQTNPLSQWLGWKAWPFGLLTFGLAAATLLRRRYWCAALPAFALSAIFFLFFSWYPVVDIRFIFPLTPIWLILAALGATVVVQWLRTARRLRLAPHHVAMCFGVALIVMGLVSSALLVARLPRPVPWYQLPDGYYELLSALRSRLASETRFALGPSHAYDYYWADLPGLDYKVPYVQSMAQFQAFIREHRIELVVVDYSIVYQRRGLFSGYFDEERRVLRVERIPEGWRCVAASDQPTPSWMLFDVSAVWR